MKPYIFYHFWAFRSTHNVLRICGNLCLTFPLIVCIIELQSAPFFLKRAFVHVPLRSSIDSMEDENEIQEVVLNFCSYVACVCDFIWRSLL